MGVGYQLVNATKKEYILFAHINASTLRELAGNEASGAITTWYLLKNIGDEISFVSDSGGEWPFRSGSRSDFLHYSEVTGRVVNELMIENILRDFGDIYVDSDEPESVYIRDLRNVWGKPKNSSP